MRNDNIEMLQDTLRILENGFYCKNGKKVMLTLSRQEMEEVRVLLPDDVRDISSRTDLDRTFVTDGWIRGCENVDSFVLARKRNAECGHVPDSRDSGKVLVLNLANPVNPGGGVRRGARAQEEDLCRKSSLLLSLESRKAAGYYDYNKKLHTFLGSDAMIITPKVEIIKDENGILLDETAVVAVLTCAAPMLRNGKEGMGESGYRDMVYNRIMGMLKCAAYFGYRMLVLGAWGCGAFHNDARVISDLFFKALKELEYNGLGEKELFHSVEFAVLDRTSGQYNFREFYRNFASHNFYRDEERGGNIRPDREY